MSSCEIIRYIINCCMFRFFSARGWSFIFNYMKACASASGSVLCVQETKEANGFDLLELELQMVWAAWCGCWELNSDPLEKQLVRLSTELFPQACVDNFNSKTPWAARRLAGCYTVWVDSWEGVWWTKASLAKSLVALVALLHTTTK